MVARVGTLAVGTRFVTLATGREGRVLFQHGGPEPKTEVGLRLRPTDVFDDLRYLHPQVRVRVVEVTH